VDAIKKAGTESLRIGGFGVAKQRLLSRMTIHRQFEIWIAHGRAHAHGPTTNALFLPESKGWNIICAAVSPTIAAHHLPQSYFESQVSNAQGVTRSHCSLNSDATEVKSFI